MYCGALWLAKNEKTASRQLFTLQVYRIVLIRLIQKAFPEVTFVLRQCPWQDTITKYTHKTSKNRFLTRTLLNFLTRTVKITDSCR